MLPHRLRNKCKTTPHSAQPELGQEYQFFAFDLAWHSKSLPPEGFETEDHLLSTEIYLETVLAVVSALAVTRPILAGCSMGGRIALQLDPLHPDRFSGFVAIEASDFRPAWYDIDWFHRPNAHGGEWAPLSSRPIFRRMLPVSNGGTPSGCSCSPDRASSGVTSHFILRTAARSIGYLSSTRRRHPFTSWSGPRPHLHPR
ncbi:alpha/beta fold hydrolase [Neorhizobium galegae]|uniref:alpha/beta fold hydrolase n=1 Tax=Neorhizobium galegae TaxID=399 RepID=UPI00203647E5|nr:alpha/beta fold hydrolase [Neorhizobium galegae]MCM2498678.1 alpha/beta hydrolase [Neorhizobium galegae]